MEDMRCKVPIGFFIFNRLDTTKKVFHSIKMAKPEKLYLISDGARDGRPGEEQKVKEVRAYVENEIDWPCIVKKDYAEKNMGCRDRMSSGITWLFEEEEMAIILEDDCKPTQDFFPYIADMLERYKDNEHVMMVSGSKLLSDYQMDASYTFSRYAMIWGWATWRRAWKKYDVNIESWREVKKSGMLKKHYTFFGYIKAMKDFDSVYQHQKDTWDHQWCYTILINNGVCIIPCVNMIENLGFGREDATHTKSDTKHVFSCKRLGFPLDHPAKVGPDEEYDRTYQRYEWGIKAVAEKVIRRAINVF